MAPDCPGLRWMRFPQAPPGQQGVGREVSHLDAHRPLGNLFGSRIGLSSVQACAGHPSGDTSLTEVRLPVPDTVTGPKATITLPLKGFLRSAML